MKAFYHTPLDPETTTQELYDAGRKHVIAVTVPMCWRSLKGRRAIYFMGSPITGYFVSVTIMVINRNAEVTSSYVTHGAETCSLHTKRNASIWTAKNRISERTATLAHAPSEFWWV
jgi:hypothetical protein